jgi:hypothetical protein
MSRILRFLLASTAIVLLACPAWAQKGDGKDAGAKQVKQMDFEGDTLEGEIMRPNQGVAEALLLEQQSSLIKVRKDFVDEILKSAEDL